MYFLNLLECHETDTGKAKDKSISMPAVFAEPAKCFLFKAILFTILTYW